MIYTAAFYSFSFIIIAAGFMVIASRNPVHSVLFLILAFFNSAALFLLLGAEFLAMIMVIVYVGAVAVLFLFVVMMLDINFVELREGFLQYLPIGALIGTILLIELVLVVGAWQVTPDVISAPGKPIPEPAIASNTEALGALLYTDYVYVFQAAGMILLVAMIGAIVLALRSRTGVKRQNIGEQVRRRPEDAIELKDVESGEGIG